MIERLKPEPHYNVRDGEKGNPIGPKNIAALIDEELARPVVVAENGKRKKISRLHAAVRQLAIKAARGDSKAFALILSMRQSAISLDQADSPQRVEIEPINETDSVEEAIRKYENSSRLIGRPKF